MKAWPLAAGHILGICSRITITLSVTIAKIPNVRSGCGQAFAGKRQLPARYATLASVNHSIELV